MTLPRSQTLTDPEIICEEGFDGTRVTVSELEHPNAVARYALDLIRTNGILSGTPDGEDSAGRAKLTVMPPDDLAKRAFDIAEAAFNVARHRGHMLAMPTQAEVIERAATAKVERDARREAAKARAKESVSA